MDSTKSDSSLLKTRFEDLSNELLYELFDYLDTCQTYKIFGHLNNRFHQLLFDSILPLKLQFSLVSKAVLQYECQNILLPNVHRVQSLRLSGHLLIERFFTCFSLDSSFIRLESIILNKIKEEKLISILSALKLLPRLSSLTIDTLEKIHSSNAIYQSLLCLPRLTYCKLSFGVYNRYPGLTIHGAESSPLEKLIIENRFDLDQLVKLLAYTPHLTLLSCRLSTAHSLLPRIIQIPHNLSDIRLQLEDTSYDEFEWFISDFAHQIHELRISSTRDLEFLNADRWERLITNRMPFLHRFDFQHHISEGLDNCHYYHTLMDQFKSSFWSDRQWFFTHQHLQSGDIRFYSTQPHRWNRCEFNSCSCQSSSSGVNLANEIELYSYQTTAYSNIRFPRIHRLTLSGGDPSYISDLTRVFSPTQITELVLSDEQLRFEQLLSLLHHFPHIHSLTVTPSILTLSVPQTSKNRLIISNNHQIHTVTILNRCTVEDIQILNRLCPDLKSLEIEVERESLEIVVHYLLMKYTNINRRTQPPIRSYSKKLTFWQHEYSHCHRCARNQSLVCKTFTVPCNHHLSFLHCRDVNYRMIEKLRVMIEKEALLSDYSMEYVYQNMYLWW